VNQQKTELRVRNTEARIQNSEDGTLYYVQLRDKVAIIALSLGHYFETVRIAAEHGLTAGQSTNALLLATARKVEAKNVYTWNIRHFQGIAPDWERRIRTP
jgi:hypothetical protein